MSKSNSDIVGMDCYLYLGGSSFFSLGSFGPYIVSNFYLANHAVRHPSELPASANWFNSKSGKKVQQ
jgi:hypothetical protein